MNKLEKLAGELEDRYRRRTPTSNRLHSEAARVLPGGDTRSGTYFPPYPAFIQRGSGSRLTDVDGNEYVDFLANFTSLVHGNAHPRIVEAIRRQAESGSAFPFPNDLQVDLAKVLCERVHSVERVRFANSGSEAVMAAIRTARAFTKKSGLLKMEGEYHGSYDAAQISINPGASPPSFPEGRPDGPGISPGMAGEVFVAPYNDLAATRELIHRHKHELAAVILEPVMTAAGVIPADQDFVQGIEETARDAGVLLILDEVVTFRYAFAGTQSLYGVEPDLTAFGKLIGGGLPVGAFGGREEIMAMHDPSRPRAIAHSGTFNGNALTMAAGLAALELLSSDAIARMNTLGEHLRGGLARELAAVGVESSVSGFGSIAQIHFRNGPVRNYREAMEAPRWCSRLLHLGLMNLGFITAARGMMVLSTVTSRSEVDALLDAVRTVTEQMSCVFEEGSSHT